MSDLDRIRKLAGILTEGLMDVPSLGNSASVPAGIDEMFGDVEETAPPGMEDMVMDLKKEYPGEPEKAFATAWSIYNKKNGKDESMMEDGALDGIIQQSASRLEDMLDSFVDYDQAVDTLMQELQGAGHSAENIEEILNGVNDLLSGETDDAGMSEPDDMSADADALASAGWGSDEDYGSAEDMMEDLNNGYDDIKFMNPGDFFPDGADSPVTSATGTPGAKQGDNPEQKKMAVAETHKELVYNYRKFLKESAKK